ncbi:MAG: GNAT family N-acetyltransferase [Actinobacteria bacterium]|nr:MAG: GNAT family N-acetyltransferase [Actinomycetota bacterium]
MECRPASAEDVARVSELLEQLGYAASPEVVGRRLQALTASPHDDVWVAERDETVVGLVAIHVSRSLEYDGDIGKVSAIVVDEAARRQGVGEQLMVLAEREARRRGCVLLFLTTAERRTDAHAFYRRLGFEETGRRFAKELD